MAEGIIDGYAPPLLTLSPKPNVSAPEGAQRFGGLAV